MENMSSWTDPKKWAQMIPNLSCDSSTTLLPHANMCNISDHGKRSKQNLINDGYTLIGGQQLDLSLVRSVAAGITTLHKSFKLPATFVLLYDQAWELAATADKDILQSIAHSKNVFNFDILGKIK